MKQGKNVVRHNNCMVALREIKAELLLKLPCYLYCVVAHLFLRGLLVTSYVTLAIVIYMLQKSASYNWCKNECIKKSFPI